ncbi:hypothetical protein [Streptomyces sp. NPDC059371]|uniref:hypothetical protein n=1 Tax=Streptomyces sp. NPDC059371 TaxID=3346812 RepID=UPI0036A564C6
MTARPSGPAGHREDHHHETHRCPPACAAPFLATAGAQSAEFNELAVEFGYTYDFAAVVPDGTPFVGWRAHGTATDSAAERTALDTLLAR